MLLGQIGGNPLGGEINVTDIQHFDNESIVFDHFNGSASSDALNRHLAVNGVAGVAADENSVVGRPHAFDGSAFLVFQHTDHHKSVVFDADHFAQDVPFLNGEQRTPRIHSQDTDIAVAVNRRKPAALHDFGAAFGKEVQRYAEQRNIQLRGSAQNVLAGIARCGNGFHIVHVKNVQPVHFGQSVGFQIAVGGIFRNVFSDRRRFAGGKQNLVHTHGFNLRQGFPFGALGNGEHGNHAADAENNTQRSQDGADFMQHEIVERKPQLIPEFHVSNSSVL